ncbi:MAG TPA: hypothetical protein VFV46_04095 [Lacibacter sp.]|nr:hypothetical protein [Lacibacter sp.]
MMQSATIVKTKAASRAMDYAFLREKGLKWIEQLASDIWTDYNTHDPGITFLELLSYAITDLGYRTSFPMKDLLSADANTNEANFKQQFFSAAEILTTRPVSEIDLRKLFIDIDGIRNAWLQKADEILYVDLKNEIVAGGSPDHKQQCSFILNGIYDVKIELDANDKNGNEWSNDSINQIKKELKSVFQANRNLSEDIRNVELIEEQKIRVCADVEIKPTANAFEVYAEILLRLHHYLSPDIGQYTLAEIRSLKKKDGTHYRMDEIFSGPVLTHGFIPDEEVQNAVLKRKIFLSDIISIMMDIEGVITVRDVKMNFCDAELTAKEEWVLCIPKGKKPGLCTDKMALHFYKDVVPVNANKEKAVALYREKMEAGRLAKKSKQYTDYVYEKGVDKELLSYNSVMHELPLVYGVSNHGLPTTASTERLAQAKQLKAYLLFFDQVLTNYLSQLFNVKNLLSSKKELNEAIAPQSYFYQPVRGIEKLDSIIYDDGGYFTQGTVLAKINNHFERDTERLNRFADHILSRFAEQFTDYVTQLYALSEHVSGNELLAAKYNFLNEYPLISKNRSGAYNYTAAPVWDTNNVSGMEHRISRLLGISNYSRHTISTMKMEVEEEIVNGVSEFRFRIKDASDNSRIVLTSNLKYSTRSACEQAFQQTMELAATRDNYELKQANDGKYFFNIIDASHNILARRIEYFTTAELAEVAIVKLILLVKQHYSKEGLFVIEHLLLRMDLQFLQSQNELMNGDNYLPVCTDGDCEGGCEKDPYSFRITVVLPGETLRFKNMDFRKFTEHLIRMETPAHIFPKICWVSNTQLAAFETAYKLWLELKQQGKQNTPEGLAVTKELIKLLYNLRSVLEKGVLPDCEEPPANPLILGRTSLGNL